MNRQIIIRHWNRGRNVGDTLRTETTKREMAHRVYDAITIPSILFLSFGPRLNYYVLVISIIINFNQFVHINTYMVYTLFINQF